MSIATASRAEGIAQEVELDVLVCLRSMNVLAIDDPRLIGMKFQATFLEPLRESFFHILRLLETAAVDQSVIGVPAEGQSRILLRHPSIEGVVQVEIRQQRRNYSPNAKGNFQFERVVTGWRGIRLLDLRLKR